MADARGARELLLTRIEDAGLNASAPPQQRWLDGWIVRFSPGKAKRARCINAVAEGRLPLGRRLALAAAVYREAGLPMVLRVTPHTRPASLAEELKARGWREVDDTRVMVCDNLRAFAAGGFEPAALPAEFEWVALDAAGFAGTVGVLRGSPPAQRAAHAQRLAASPVPYRGYAIRRRGGVDDENAVVACGQVAREAELVGLYDVVTRESERGRGWGRRLCERLLALAAADGAEVAYLQCDADNGPARRLYRALGFADGYAYHYLEAPGRDAVA